MGWIVWDGSYGIILKRQFWETKHIDCNWKVNVLEAKARVDGLSEIGREWFRV